MDTRTQALAQLEKLDAITHWSIIQCVMDGIKNVPWEDDGYNMSWRLDEKGIVGSCGYGSYGRWYENDGEWRVETCGGHAAGWTTDGFWTDTKVSVMSWGDGEMEDCKTHVGRLVSRVRRVWGNVKVNPEFMDNAKEADREDREKAEMERTIAHVKWTYRGTRLFAAYKRAGIDVDKASRLGLI